jgi:hypothetical protein
LIPDKLESLVKESLRAGEKPFFVGLTAGTTVLGFFFKYLFEKKKTMKNKTEII